MYYTEILLFFSVGICFLIINIAYSNGDKNEN